MQASVVRYDLYTEWWINTLQMVIFLFNPQTYVGCNIHTK